MAMERFGPPPSPSTPERAPWDEVRLLAQKIDKLIEVMQRPAALMAPMLIPGAPGTVQQLTLLLQELVPETMGRSAIIPFQKSVATAYQDEQERIVPFSGVIRDVIMAFPAGCQQLVEVCLKYFPQGGSYSWIIPTITESYIALDDFTVLFQPRFPIKAPGMLRVEWWNYDSLNTHNVPVIATIFPSRVGGSP